MNRPRFQLKRSRPAYAALLALGLVPLGGYLYWQRLQPPVSNTPLYQSSVRSFFAGLAALQAGDLDHAKGFLSEVTTQVPQEPAGWANLGIAQIRLADYESASRSLAEASRLAPQSAPIEAALADLEAVQGRADAALPHLRRSLQLDPSSTRARYALALALANTGDAGAKAEVRALYEQLLRSNPGNVVLLTEALRQAATSGDAAGFRARQAELGRLSPRWTPEVREQFAAVQAAARGGAGAAVLPLIPFTNVIKPTAPYQAALAALGANAETGASSNSQPLERFLWLKPTWPGAKPSPPDQKLAFSPQPFPSNDFNASALAATFLNEKGAPAIFAAGSPARSAARAASTTSALLWSSVAPDFNLTFPAHVTAGGVPASADGILALDWNFDFKNDLFLAGQDGLKLLQQDSPSKFRDVTASLKLPQAVTRGDYVGAWAADIEADGDLDIVLARRSGAPVVLRNNGDGTAQVLEPFARLRDVRGFAWADFDDDGAIDAAFVDAKGQIHVFANERAGAFSERSAPPSVGKLLAIGAADIDSDGAVDLIGIGLDGAVLRCASDADGASWQTQEAALWYGDPQNLRALQPGQARLTVADLDNNGALDLVASDGKQSRAWLGDTENALKPLEAPIAAAVFGALDLNGDGRLDLAALDAAGAPIQLLNRGTLPYRWQILRPQAQPIAAGAAGAEGGGNQRINPFGVGGTIEARAGLLYQKQLISGPVVHFGLGTHDATDAIRITWTNGATQAEFALGAGQSLLAQQRPTGSCPYLWAFDGKAMRFVKDCNWRSPLGLRINAQDTAGVVQTADWGKVRGDQIAPRGGFYDLRVTADLWEAHMFDSLGLLAVDHPEGSEIWVDERFSIPMPPLGVITTGEPQAIQSARDDHGRDVSGVVRDLDRQYLDTFGKGQYQGVSRDHWAEIELPASAQVLGAPLWLIAEGWLHPTDSSINVALAQGKHDPPRDLSLEVADGHGGWRVARPHLGFPAGKNKAIVLDLKDVFRAGEPRRLRLRTNLEIYWDRLRWAGPPPRNAAAQTTQLRVKSADLRYRGVSPETRANPSSPALPGEYQDVRTGQFWRDLVGFYTRFGDVKPLLARTDDRYVIMNAGDEMRLKFAVPPAPRAGWKRDFVFMTDGWTKDGNLNTGFSKTLLPLPLHGQPNDNRPPGRLQDDAAYKRNPRDWANYHTRYISAERFRSALRPRAQPHKAAPES